MELTQLLDASVGTLALLALLYFVWSNRNSSRDMLATVKVLTDASAANSQSAAAALKKAEATTEVLEGIGVRIESASGRHTDELIKQTAVLGGLNDGLKATVQSVSDGAVQAVTAQISTHDAGVMDALREVNATLTELRDEVRSSHAVRKADKAEMMGKLDTLQAGIERLLPAPVPDPLQPTVVVQTAVNVPGEGGSTP